MSDPVPGPAPVTEQAPEDQIGTRIAERRLIKGLTHDGLAKLTKLFDKPTQAGISRTTIRGYEVGLYKPGTRELRLLSQALEVSPGWLIFGGPLEGSAPTVTRPDSVPVHTELQKFLVALTLLRGVEAADRQIVYDVLHGLARLRHGENVYRAAVITYGEMGALVGDVWADMKEHGGKFDDGKVQELVTAYGPQIDAIVERELGMKLSDIRSKK